MSTLASGSALAESPISPRTVRPSFFGLVRSEIFKTVRQWTPWIALVLMMGIILFPFLIFFNVKGAENSLSALLSSPDNPYFYERAPIGLALLRAFGGIVMLIVTARIIGQEYSLGTIRIVLARGVGRVQFLMAKLTAALILALGLLVIGLLEVLLIVAVQIQIVTGSLNALINLPPNVWHDLGIYILSIGISLVVTILMATAVSVLFRSLSGGLSGSLVWFPVDNFLILMMALVNRLTGNDFWLNVTAYLLGPNLNIMAGMLANRQNSPIWGFGLTPDVTVDSNHVLLTALVYAVIFLATALILTWKRDVKE